MARVANPTIASWMADLCPRCALREVEPEAPAGWCSECVIDNIREKYSTKTAAASLKRREAWSERSQASWDRDRQRVSRLRKIVKPRVPSSHADPWEVASEALHATALLRKVKMRPEQFARLDLAEEALRRLAWGPDEEPKPEPQPAESEDGPRDGWQSWESWGRRQIG